MALVARGANGVSTAEYTMDKPWVEHSAEALSRILLDAGANTATVFFKDELVAISGEAWVLRETGYPPRIYLPIFDVRTPLRQSERRTYCPWKGHAVYYDIEVGGETLSNGAWCYEDPYAHLARIAGLVAFDNRFRMIVG